MIESKRIKKFRLELIKILPKFPNNKSTFLKLEQEPLSSLLIYYVNWASRYVPNRPRLVKINNVALSDPRWAKLSRQIDLFLKKIREGEDLIPHLSLNIHTKGWSPEASGKSEKADRWMDKDFLLTVMGYHHFHLGTISEEKEFASRTNEVLFARVSRENFEVIGLFDHSVFEKRASPDQEIGLERARLWSLFEENSTNKAFPGSVVLISPITTSGHAMHFVRIADDYSRVIREVDRQLEDPAFRDRLFKTANVCLPKKYRLEWTFEFLDLCLWEKNSNNFFILREGPI